MVISDPRATKAAAAMSVDVGAASDPVDLPGLAHFLEHMLFLGEQAHVYDIVLLFFSARS